VEIDWDRKERESESESSSDSSMELEVVEYEYIPKRTSLTKVFNINIVMNEYNEQRNKIKWDYSPTPNDEDKQRNDGSDSVQSNLSTLSILDAFDENAKNEIARFKPSNSMKMIEEGDDEEDDEQKEEEIEKDAFKRIDTALSQYYQYFDRKDYFNKDGKGKFMAYCIEKKLLNADKLKEQFDETNDNAQNIASSVYLGFDEKFPLILTNPIYENEEKKQTAKMRAVEIYNVMEYCFHHGQSPYF